MVDNNGNFTSLPETRNENTEYNNAAAGLRNLQARIQAQTAMPAASQSQLDSYQSIIDDYNSITRVEKNKVFKIQMPEITNFAVYKCSVYYNGVFIGTGSISLTNSLDAEDAYSLVINNGSQVFKYNESGVSPVSDTNENPFTIPPLSFTIYDNLGQPIADDVAEHCEIEWIVPTENTMLQMPTTYQPDSVDLINKTETYKKLMTLTYQVSQRHSVAKIRNNITLKVTYKGMTLTKDTNFTFAKEGEPGTNGTEFLCRIVPNTANPPLYPMVLNGQINYTPRQSGRWFRVQLWHSGVMIFDNTQTGTTDESKTATVV